MDNYTREISHNPLFDDISFDNIETVVQCIGAREKKYSKNQSIIRQGDRIDFVGIVLSGAVKITKSDFNGKEIIIGEISKGDVFGEVFACAEVVSSPVWVEALTETRVLFLPYSKIITSCSSSCQFHHRLISNMLKIIARKNLYLNQRIEIISKPSLREKINSYFTFVSKGEKEFTIPLSRQELASYISADRSALSNELSKMQKEGLIKYHKNSFQIL